VKQNPLGRNQRFPQRPIQDFLSSDPKNWHALFATAAFADVPLGFQVDYAFNYKTREEHHPCKLVLRHAVWQHGIPVERTEHGHKHFLCFEGHAPSDPLWNSLPP
jgi:hypothetical protein